jgi:putative ABC transport system permease protein
MAYPPGMKVAYLADDTSNQLNFSAMRIVFIPKLVNDVDIVCNCLTYFVLAITLIVTYIVINKYVVSSRKNIGILLSNGVNKSKICFSLTPFALIPSIFGGLLGYIVGF